MNNTSKIRDLNFTTLLEVADNFSKFEDFIDAEIEELTKDGKQNYTESETADLVTFTQIKKQLNSLIPTDKGRAVAERGELERSWIQSNTDFTDPYYKFYGNNVLVDYRTLEDGMITVYFTEGNVLSAQIPVTILKQGWRNIL